MAIDTLSDIGAAMQDDAILCSEAHAGEYTCPRCGAVLPYTLSPAQARRDHALECGHYAPRATPAPSITLNWHSTRAPKAARWSTYVCPRCGELCEGRGSLWDVKRTHLAHCAGR